VSEAFRGLVVRCHWIFSCFGFAFRDHAKNGIHNDSRIDQLHLNAGNDWGYFAEVRAQVDGVFFGSDEGVGVILVS
jgi:hypothetical protein